MASDILLNDGDDQNRVTIQATIIQTQASDLILDAPTRRASQNGLRRALVHDASDGLTLNYNGDYPGGITLLRVNRLNLKARQQDSGTPSLPKSATVGDLVMLRNVVRLADQVVGDDCTLWLCVDQQRDQAGTALWKQVQLGDIVAGTE